MNDCRSEQQLVYQAFEEEYSRLLADRGALPRLAPTPACFPLFCQLMQEAATFYENLPRIKRNTMRFIPFSCFGKAWALRVNFAAIPCTGALYIDLCSADKHVPLVTLCIGIENDLLEADDA